MLVMLLTLTLLSGGSAQEASPLTGAFASTTDEDSAYPAALLSDLKFLESARTTTGDTNGGGLKEFSLVLTAQHKFTAIAAINNRHNGNWSKTWNDASIWVGTDTTYLSTALTDCNFMLNDNFLRTLPLHCQQIASDVITFRRDSFTGGLYGGSWFAISMNELRVYQCVLLTGVPGLTVTIHVEHTEAT